MGALIVNKKAKFYLIAFIIAFIGITYLTNQEKTDKNSSVPNSEKPTQESKPKKISAADKIDIHAYSEYTKESFPVLYDQVGVKGFEALYKHDVESAYKIAALDECDRVTYSAYSKEMSSYPSRITSFVDCSNGNRYYVSGDNIQKR